MRETGSGRRFGMRLSLLVMDASISDKMLAPQAPESIAGPLLAWYDVARRDLPWRARPGEAPDPYRVWLSEVMLQQTTVAAVAPRFERFLARWPTVDALAAAPDEDVMAEWAGLGYYARARNLLKCARAVRDRFGGAFPTTEAALATLPGVGPYTAAAVAAIAFGRQATPVDGNIERVTARLFQVEEPLPASKPEIKALATQMTPAARAGDYAQAMMDLGATVCLPRTPRCLVCPLNAACAARAAGVAAELPRKAAKKAKPLRTGEAYWIEREDGRLLLRRRQPKGLLGGMLELPSYGWSDDDAPAGLKNLADDWTTLDKPVTHVFTHFRLELTVLAGIATSSGQTPDDCQWTPLDALADAGLPSVMAKAAKTVLAAE